MDSITVIHGPVLVPCISRQASMARASAMDSSSAVYVFCTSWIWISPCPYFRSRVLSPVLDSVMPKIAVTRFHVTTPEAVQFYKGYRVGLSISYLYYKAPSACPYEFCMEGMCMGHVELHIYPYHVFYPL